MRRMLRPLVLLTIVGCLFVSSPVRACPACKDTVANGDASAEGNGLDTLSSGAGGGVSGGFNTSIYLMLAAFFGTLGLVGHAMYRGARSSARSQDKSSQRRDAEDMENK